MSLGIRLPRALSRSRIIKRREWVPSPADDADRLPTNSSVPTITGTGAVGETLTASVGVWALARPTAYTYQWKKGGVAISGATSQTYEVQAGDSGANITVTVTAYNMIGTATATSTNKAIA